MLAWETSGEREVPVMLKIAANMNMNVAVREEATAQAIARRTQRQHTGRDEGCAGDMPSPWTILLSYLPITPYI
jgi:hypothetical protein